MKLYIPLLAALIFLLSNLQGQTFNYEEVKFKYNLPPKTPFTTPFKTISVRFHGDDHLKRYGILTSELTSSDFKFKKFTNTPEHGDLHLDVFVGEPSYLGVKQESQSRKENNVDVIYYFYRGTVITPLAYELRDGARNLIEEKIVFSASDHLTFTSDWYNSPSELEKGWAQSQNISITKQTTEILRSSLAETARTVRDSYDDQIIEEKITMFDIKKPEKIQAEFLNTAFSKITSGLAQNMVWSDWDDAKKTDIKNLLMKGTTFSTEDNDERIAYAIAHYDLAVLNLYWNDVAAAKMHIKKGKIADRKVYEFEQLEKRIPALEGRGVSDDVSSKAYVAAYEEGADSKLPPLNKAGGATGSAVASDKSRTVDTVYARNGDVIIGYTKCVHKMRKMGEDQMHDFTHVVINPLNKPQEEISVTYDQIIYMKHKGLYMIPLPTKIATAPIPPIHLYEPVQISTDQKLALMRTACHESMPYELSASDMRAYLYTYKDKKEDEDYEILAVSGGSRYALGLNGALAKDFEFCPTIVARAKNKEYKLEEDLLSSLVTDYDGCVK
jgi:hypothetical protein